MDNPSDTLTDFLKAFSKPQEILNLMNIMEEFSRKGCEAATTLRFAPHDGLVPFITVGFQQVGENYGFEEDGSGSDEHGEADC